MKRRPRRARQTPQLIQVLESRALLSATLENGVLTLEGTSEDDILRVRPDRDDPTIVVARVNDESFEFPAEDVSEIVINGHAGNDRLQIARRLRVPGELSGGEGDDKLAGGPEADVLDGGPGRDRISGGLGSDVLNGGEDGDRMNGGLGSDTMNGGGGNDAMFGHFGADVMFGGDGDDLMDGSRGNDVMAGENGNDLMRGGAGDDDMSGGDGNDKMSAGQGSDMLFGENGDDTLGGNSNTDILDGGPGENVIRDQRRGGRGRGGDFDRGRRAKMIFRRLDSDRDRTLTSDEVAADRFADLLEFDADDSGDISFHEFLEWFKNKTGGGGGEGTP